MPLSGWQADAAWTLGGFHSSVGVLPAGAAYGSWSGSDANQGGIVSAPFSAESHSCLAVPVAHGPSLVGQSVNVLDADTGRKVMSITELTGMEGDVLTTAELFRFRGGTFESTGLVSQTVGKTKNAP